MFISSHFVMRLWSEAISGPCWGGLFPSGFETLWTASSEPPAFKNSISDSWTAFAADGSRSAITSNLRNEYGGVAATVVIAASSHNTCDSRQQPLWT
jgi:hypothetical protein